MDFSFQLVAATQQSAAGLATCQLITIKFLLFAIKMNFELLVLAGASWCWLVDTEEECSSIVTTFFVSFYEYKIKLDLNELGSAYEPLELRLKS